MTEAPSDRTITSITRRALFGAIVSLGRVGISWYCGRPEHEAIASIFDIDALPSNDPRADNMRGDVATHRDTFVDWDDDWLFTDPRLNLLHCPDEVLLRFLCGIVHPEYRGDTKQAENLVAVFNTHLVEDGWELAVARRISGRPVYTARRLASTGVRPTSPPVEGDILSDAYVRELIAKCEDRLAMADYEGAVTASRTLLEAVLRALELRIAGAANDYKGELPKQYKHVSKLLHMDDENPNLDESFKGVVRGFVGVVHGLARLRNSISDGHPRARKPAPHHARLVVNAAKTIVIFLVESYGHQKSKERLP